MFYQFFVKALKSKMHLLKGAALATAATLFGVVVSSCPANAQATYIYTGNHYTFAIGSYTTSQRVTATLQLSSWLPPNGTCIDVTQMPGFRLIMNDGLGTVDSIDIPREITAAVSTDEHGQITGPWALTMSLQSYIATSTIPKFASDCGGSAFPNQDTGIRGLVFDNRGLVFGPGVWSYPSPDALIEMLLNQVKLGVLPDIGGSLSTQLNEVSADIGTGNGRACQDLRGLINHISAQIDKKITPPQADFMLATLAIVQSNLQCNK